MRTPTKLRLFGAAVVLFNLWLVGEYRLSAVPTLLLTFGFAALYEWLVVRPSVVSSKTPNRSEAPSHARLPAVVTPAAEIAQIKSVNPAPLARPPSDAATTHCPGASDELLWAEAAAEWEGLGRRSGLWARLFAEAKGDANLAKATYLSERFRELKEATSSDVAQLCETKKSGTQDSEECQPTLAAKSVDDKLDDLRASVRAFGHYRHAVAVAEALGYTVEEVGMGFFRGVAVRVVADNRMHIFDSHNEFIEWAKAAG